jgi:hypothetical protein
VQAADEKAVDADQLARMLAVDVRLGSRLARRFKRRAVAGDQRQALGARVQAMLAKGLVDAVR